MGWSIGYDETHKRDVGYGVPATCDHPDCNAEIDRGLSRVCGAHPFGGEQGCGLYFCGSHLRHGFWGDENLTAAQEEAHDGERVQLCASCLAGEDHFPLKPDVREWIEHKLNDPSWQEWRDENPDDVAKIMAAIAAMDKGGKQS